MTCQKKIGKAVSLTLHGCRNSLLDKLPLELPRMWLPWSRQDGLLMCTPWGYVTEECLETGRGLLPWEWHHFQQQHLSSQGTAGADQFTGESGREPVVLHAVPTERAQHSNLYHQHDQRGIMPHVTEVGAEATRMHVMGLQHHASLLLDSLVQVSYGGGHSQEEKRYLQMQQECLVLDTPAYMAKFALHEWGSSNTSTSGDAGAQFIGHVLKGRLHQRKHGAAAGWDHM